jgi:hypothetical protein
MAHSYGQSNSKKAAQCRAAAITDSDNSDDSDDSGDNNGDAGRPCSSRPQDPSPRPQRHRPRRPRGPPTAPPETAPTPTPLNLSPVVEQAARLNAAKPAKTKLRKDIDISRLLPLSTIPNRLKGRLGGRRATHAAARSHHHFIQLYHAWTSFFA